MVIVETSVFTRQVQELLSEKEYRELQSALIGRPGLGKLVPGTGGLRKVRWQVSGRGKRGGAQVIYYWAVSLERILMLFAYPKAERSDLTVAQLRALRKVVEEQYP